jgi:hypothetical protein
MEFQMIGVALMVAGALLVCWQYSPPAKNAKRKPHAQAQKKVDPVVTADWRTPESELIRHSYLGQDDWRFPYEFDNRTEVERRRSNGEAIASIREKLRLVDVTPKAKGE